MVRFVDGLFVVAAIAACVAVIVGMVGPVQGGGMSLSSKFTWHPILMSAAFPCLMMMGRWAYVTESIGDKEAQRSVHRMLMMLATIVGLGGYVAIFLAHLPLKSFFGYNFSTGKWGTPTRVAHDLIGYAILLMTLAQCAMGLRKIAGLNEGRASFKFHGTLGKAIMGLSAVNIVLASIFWGWSTGYKILVALLTVAVTIFATLMPSTKDPESTPIMEEAKA